MTADPNCIFCKIVAGTIPAKSVYEDDQVLAFSDVHPQAPTHILLIPKAHLSSLGHSTPEHAPLLGKLLSTATEVARHQHLDKGYRVVINTGPDGGQTVDHLHLHILGGRPMHWPPG